jgi:putative tricarboxylic transport membrane protein
MIERLKAQIPYVIVFLLAGFLYYRATQIEFAAPGGRIGPDIWPKIILGLAMLTAAYEVIKNLIFFKGRHEIDGVLESIIEAAPPGPHAEVPGDAPAKSYPWLLVIGAGMTIAYAALIPTLGFFLCTVMFLAGFTWVGRYRRKGVILASSLLGGLVFMFVFMKVVYISLPLGVGPFGQFSIFLMQLMGIR